MKALQLFAMVLARFFLSAVFLASSIQKILHWQEEEKILLNTLVDWQSLTGFSEHFSWLVAWSPLLLIIATLFELIGALLLLLGVQERLGAFLLILFLIPTTILFHPFWFTEVAAREIQTAMFLKNLAILGGLLLVALRGAKGESPKADFYL